MLSSRRHVLELTAQHKELMAQQQQVQLQARRAKKAQKKGAEGEGDAIQHGRCGSGSPRHACARPRMASEVRGGEQHERQRVELHRASVREVSARA